MVNSPLLLYCSVALYICKCQTPVLGLGLGVDFTLANNNNNKNNLHLNFQGLEGTRGLKFVTQT